MIFVEILMHVDNYQKFMFPRIRVILVGSMGSSLYPEAQNEMEN